MIIDSHCHLLSSRYEKPINEIIDKCRKNNLSLLLNIATKETEFDEDVKDYRWIKGVGAYLEISTHSAFFSRKVFEEVGYFDSVRFGADNELRKRFKAMGYNVSERKEIVTYYYLKREGSLTCNIATGYNKGKSKIREVYIENYTKWHEEIKNKKYFMEFPLEERPFRVTARHKPGKVDLSTFTEIS